MNTCKGFCWLSRMCTLYVVDVVSSSLAKIQSSRNPVMGVADTHLYPPVSLCVRDIMIL